VGLQETLEREEERRKNKNKKEERKTWRDESDEIFYWCVKGKNKLKFKT
jgi:hypothetical protein